MSSYKPAQYLHNSCQNNRHREFNGYSITHGTGGDAFPNIFILTSLWNVYNNKDKRDKMLFGMRLFLIDILCSCNVFWLQTRIDW